jgi:hypothetical protein
MLEPVHLNLPCKQFENSDAATHLEQLQAVLHLPVLDGGDEPHDDVERQQDPTSPEQVYLESQGNACQLLNRGLPLFLIG